MPPKQNIQSPVIMDSLEEDSHPIHNIKSNVHYASGHKFDSATSKVVLVKNLRRNGDFNEGVKEATSSGSKFEQSPRLEAYSSRKLFKDESKGEGKKENNKSYDSAKKKMAKYMHSPGHELLFENENDLKMKLNFDKLYNKKAANKETQNVMDKIQPLANLESLSKGSPLITSSRRGTERKEELESETLELVAEIRNSFNTVHRAPETKTTFYKVGRVLGKGAFGKVNLAMHLLAKRLGK